MTQPFLGQVEMFGFNFPPKGWSLCNGQLLPINQNQALFSLLGTTYGGNGQTNFALPDLRSRVPTSFGSNTQGVAAGEEAHTLIKTEMPQHVHSLSADATTASTSNSNAPVANGSLGQTSGRVTPGTQTFTANLYNAANPNAVLNSATIGNAGNSQAHNNLMPYLVINFCIALQGIFPSRN
jgi:microcystin-dependent protein